MDDRLFRRCLVGLFVIGLVLVYISRYTGIDLLLSDWMYDPVRQDFPWRGRWFTAVFMHAWVKYLLIGIGVAMLGVLAIGWALSPVWLGPALKRKLGVVIASWATVPLVVSLMKSQSMHHCPWDLQRYGGYAPYLRLFDHLPAQVKAGHCFPGGHASAGLWLASLAVFWLPERPRMAALVFAAGLIPGLLLGWTQQMRGAHFLTHTLWSAWVASLIIVLIARYLPGLPKRVC